MIEEEKKPLLQRIQDKMRVGFSHVPLVDKLFFVDHLRVMIGAGLSLSEALHVLSKEVENKAFQVTIAEISADVEQGTALSQAMAKHSKIFPEMYVNMIESGEIAGKLEESLKQVETQMRKAHELSSTIRGAMIYPAVILVAMVLVGIVMAVWVLPKLLLVFEEFDSELPLMTRVLISIINFTKDPINLAIIITVFAILVVIFVMLLRTQPPVRRAVHAMNLHLPIAGPIIKKINLARFSLTLSSLLKSTIPIIKATEITAQTCSNVLYRQSLNEAAKDITTGIPLSDVLARHPNLYPPMVTEMILVGERSGQVDQLLDELAAFYNDEVNKTMKNFATIIEPVIILVLGLVVAGLAVAVIMPMYTLVQGF